MRSASSLRELSRCAVTAATVVHAWAVAADQGEFCERASVLERQIRYDRLGMTGRPAILALPAVRNRGHNTALTAPQYPGVPERPSHSFLNRALVLANARLQLPYSQWVAVYKTFSPDCNRYTNKQSQLHQQNNV